MTSPPAFDETLSPRPPISTEYGHDMPIATFAFPDIEGSTRRWQAHPEEMKGGLAAHDSLIANALASRPKLHSANPNTRACVESGRRMSVARPLEDVQANLGLRQAEEAHERGTPLDPDDTVKTAESSSVSGEDAES